jgi:two-component system, cell cycle response regulator DivK
MPAHPTSHPLPLVLIVEDDRDNREMYAELLACSGVRVAQSATADDAIEKAHVLRPDIITMDIGLGGHKDGCQVTEELKRDARTKHIPVVAVTAWAMGGHADRARAAGCDAVLLKPTLPEALLSEILRLLDVSR